MKHIFRLLAVVAVAVAIFTGQSALANGGDQRIAEGKYIVNLSRAPYTPRVGEKTTFIASFADVAKDALITEELIVRIRIAQLADESGKEKFLYEQGDVRVSGGVLDFAYTFAQPGLHEIFVDFASASAPDKIYSPPDFLLDVQPQLQARENLVSTCPMCQWMTGTWGQQGMMGAKYPSMMSGVGALWSWWIFLVLVAIPVLAAVVLVLAILWLAKKIKKK